MNKIENKPPKGISIESNFGEIIINVRLNRLYGIIMFIGFLILAIIFFAKIYDKIASNYLFTFMYIFAILYVLFYCIYMIFGKLIITISSFEISIFRGIGKIGRTQNIFKNEITKIELVKIRRKNENSTTLNIYHSNNFTSIGVIIPPYRLEFLELELKKLLKL